VKSRAGIGPEVGHGGVERFLPAAEDEDEGAFLDEAFCSGEADAGGAARDDCGLSIQSGHVVHPSRLSPVIVWDAPENPKMDPPASVVECGSAHIGGAKSIRTDD
jgi:hypothetical protein